MKLIVDKQESMPLPEIFTKNDICFNNIITTGGIKHLGEGWYALQIAITIPAKLFVGNSDDIRLEKAEDGFILQWDWIESVCSVDSDMVDEYSYDIAEAAIYHRLNLKLRIKEATEKEQQVYTCMEPYPVLHNSYELQPIRTNNELHTLIVPHFIFKI